MQWNAIVNVVSVYQSIIGARPISKQRRHLLGPTDTCGNDGRSGCKLQVATIATCRLQVATFVENDKVGACSMSLGNACGTHDDDDALLPFYWRAGFGRDVCWEASSI